MVSKRVTILSFALIVGFVLTASGQEIERNPKEAYFDKRSELKSVK